MPITETSTAYRSEMKDVHVGDFSHAFTYTVVATASASANALVVLGPRVQNGLYIMGIDGCHSSGADSCPCDIGIDAAGSQFATQVTQKVNVTPASFKAQAFPYRSSVSDDAAALYQTVKFALSAGTNTTGIVLKYSVRMARNPE